jgi:hypothetical protein
MGTNRSGKPAPPIPLDHITAKITGRVNPREERAILRRLSLETLQTRNQQIAAFTHIINSERDMNWTKGQIGIVFHTGKRQLNRVLRLISDVARREQPGRLCF